MLNRDGNVVGVHPCVGSGSIGELGRLEPMANLVLDFLLSPDLRAEAGSGEGALDSVVRNDSGCKNGGEKGGSSPGSWNGLSDKLRRAFEGVRCGCDCKYWYGFR